MIQKSNKRGGRPRKSSSPGGNTVNQDFAAEREDVKTRSKGSAAASGRSGELDRWERFWFAPQSYKLLRLPRIGLGLLSFIYVLGFIFEVDVWFSATGLMASERLGELVVANESADAAVWRWSLLHLIDSAWLLQAFFATVAACALAVTFGWGGRWTILGLWLGIVSIANASWVLAEVGLIPLCLGLVTLLVSGLGPAKRSESCHNLNSLNTLAIRLTQIHVIGFLLAYAFSSLLNENPIGTGLQRQLLVMGFDWLPAHPLICKILHAVLLAVPLGSVPLLVFFPGIRNRVLIAILLHACVIGWLSGDFFFGASIAIMAMVF